MKRPRKTRLRWMMEMPGMSVPPHPNPYGSPTELPKHIRCAPTIATNKMRMILTHPFVPQCNQCETIENGSNGTVRFASSQL